MNIPKLRFKDNNDNDYPNWVNSTIGKSGYFYYGKSAPKWSITDTATTPCVRYGELYTTHNIIVKKIYSYTNIPKENLKFSTGNEVLVPRVGEEPLDFCKCCYLPFKDVAIGEMISVYNTKNNPLFISYMFNGTMKYKFARLVEGGNVSNLYYSYLENISINLPCLVEQKKIANFLSTVDKKITNLENTITSLENQKKGLLQQIFSQKLRFKDKNGNNYPNWEKKKLGDIGSFSRGGNLSKSDLSKKGTSCILYGELYTYYNEFATEIKSKTLNTTNLVLSKKYDVLLPLSGETAEDISTCTCIFFDDIALGSDLLIFRSSFFDGRFMSLLLKYKYKYKIAQIAQGKSIVHISEKNIKNINIKIPCIEEQQNIADFILIFTKKLENQKAQLEHWKQIKKGLLQQMFV